MPNEHHTNQYIMYHLQPLYTTITTTTYYSIYQPYIHTISIKHRIG